MTATERELTVDELDIEEALTKLWFYSGAAMTGLGEHGAHPEQAKKTADALWDLIPFMKALGYLARENPDRARELWAQALREPMPFGGAPLGMPKAPLRPATEADWQAFGKEET